MKVTWVRSTMPPPPGLGIVEGMLHGGLQDWRRARVDLSPATVMISQHPPPVGDVQLARVAPATWVSVEAR